MINWLCYKRGHCSDTPSFLLIPRYTNSPIDTALTPQSQVEPAAAWQTSCWHVTNTRVAPAPSESLRTGRMRSAHCKVGRGWLACERKMWKIKKEKKWKRFACEKNAECEINMFVKFQLWNMTQSEAGPSMEFINCRWLEMLLIAAVCRSYTAFWVLDWWLIDGFTKCAICQMRRGNFTQKEIFLVWKIV